MYILVPKERALVVSSHGGIFQMMFVKVTHEHLVLNIRTPTIHRIILIFIMASSTFLLKFYLPSLQYWQLPCYCVCVSVVGINITMFRGMFRGLITAGTTLNKCFKVRKSCVLTQNHKDVSLFRACLVTLHCRTTKHFS
jgi:hypothetical protein